MPPRNPQSKNQPPYAVISVPVAPNFSDSIFLTFQAFSGQALVKKMGSEKCRPPDRSTGNSKEAILGAVRWRTGATGGFVYPAD